MIITRLMGGLGNQMFQYALGKMLAEIHHTKLKLDLSWFENFGESTPRVYELGIFNIKEDFSSSLENYFFKNKVHFKYLKLNSKRHIIQQKFEFEPKVLNLPNNVYIDGYWQSEKYFDQIEYIIRNEFTFKLPLTGQNLEISKKISDSNSISLHIRRGDYVLNPETNAHHGICSLEYYKKAVDLISSRIENPSFFVFSDDLNWARENLKIPFETIFIDWNTKENSYIDMQLMSMCKHNIVANSSFSWWGAWLNQNGKKIVIAPDKWLNDITKNTSDLVNESWIKL